MFKTRNDKSSPFFFAVIVAVQIPLIIYGVYTVPLKKGNLIH